LLQNKSLEPIGNAKVKVENAFIPKQKHISCGFSLLILLQGYDNTRIRKNQSLLESESKC
jgi:hypothetical protein